MLERILELRMCICVCMSTVLHARALWCWTVPSSKRVGLSLSPPMLVFWYIAQASSCSILSEYR